MIEGGSPLSLSQAGLQATNAHSNPFPETHQLSCFLTAGVEFHWMVPPPPRLDPWILPGVTEPHQCSVGSPVSPLKPSSHSLKT